MSRQAQLPPRCPRPANFQANSPPRQSGHQKSISQSFVLDDHPSWLNDLLNDSDTDSYPILHHRRAASDSLTSLNDLALLQDMDQLQETESVDSCGTNYGPNSPRRKENLGFPEREMVSVFSEYSVQNMMQTLDGCNSSSSGDVCGSTRESNAESKLSKRHPGQRSRARKLQHIAELERTVEIIQNLRSELTVRVASLLQQRTALSMENSTLKQQLLRVQQEKYIADGQYRSLKKEVERLRLGSSGNKVLSRSRPYGYADHSDAIWNMLDMRKLNLN